MSLIINILVVPVNHRVLHVLTESPGGVLPYMGHIGMCCCEGYGFQAVSSSIGRVGNKEKQIDR